MLSEEENSFLTDGSVSMPELMPNLKSVKEDIIGFIKNDSILSLFFEGTIQLKLFRILNNDYPKFHNAYSLQVKSGHDRKTIMTILKEWERFKLVETIKDVKNHKRWRLNNGKSLSFGKNSQF